MQKFMGRERGREIETGQVEPMGLLFSFSFLEREGQSRDALVSCPWDWVCVCVSPSQDPIGSQAEVGVELLYTLLRWALKDFGLLLGDREVVLLCKGYR